MPDMILHNNIKVAEFKAPEGKKRDIVFDYYMKMAKVEWTPAEDFTITHAPGQEKSYKVELNYKAGKKYYGIPYGNTKANFDEFMEHVNDGKYACDSYWYTEVIGNHCSSSMFLAYQQVIPVGYGTLRPSEARTGLFTLAGNLKNPGPGVWHSKTVFELNGEEAVYEAFTTVEYGDILFKCIPGSGHVRMVSGVDVVRTEDGKVDPEQSFVHVVEHTNLWYTEEQNSTWWIDKKYTFARLFKTEFMPITVDTFHDNTPIPDAYMLYNGNNTAETYKDGLSGVVFSNFPLNYVRITIKDSDGNIVKKMHIRDLSEVFEVDLAEKTAELGLFDLPAGTYKYTLRAGIARGACELESFEFTV